MKKLTVKDILDLWVYVCRTEANGKHYHDLKSDRSAVVYAKHTKVFSGRKEGIKGNYPACYNNVETIT